MNELFKPFKGYFKIECIDKDGNIKDSYEENNFIMRPARRTVAEIFSNFKNEGLNRLVLGTSGGSTTPYIPITEEKGFSKDRTHLYSEPIKTSNGSSLYLYKYEIVEVSNKTYRYIGENKNVFVDVNSSDFEEIENYIYNFNIKQGIKKPDGATNHAENVNNICNISIDPSGDLDSTIVTYTFELDMSQGNGKGSAFFNEAGMYFNGKLFCSKCFTPKVKDESTKIKLIWKIIF